MFKTYPKRVLKTLTMGLIAVTLSSNQAHAVFNNAKDGMIRQATGIKATDEVNQQVNEPGCNSSTPAAAFFCVQKVLTYAELALMGYTLYELIKSKDAAKCTGATCFDSNTTPTTFDAGEASPTTTLDRDVADVPDGLAPDTTNPNGITDPKELGLDLDQLQKDVDLGLKDLKKKGYSVDTKTGKVTTPQGQFNASALGSPAAMKAAGFTDEQIAAAREAQDKFKSALDKKYNDLMKKMGTDEGDYSGMSARFGNTSGSGFQFKPLHYQKPKATVSGLSKSDGKGGQIGVAADDMFGMIHRRYQEQRSQSQFIETTTVTTTSGAAK